MVENTKKIQQAQPAEESQSRSPGELRAPMANPDLQRVMATCPLVYSRCYCDDTSINTVDFALHDQFDYFLEFMLERGGSGRPISFKNGVEIRITARDLTTLTVDVRATRPFTWCTGTEEALVSDTDELLANCLAVRHLLSIRDRLMTPKLGESQKDYVNRVNYYGVATISGVWDIFAEGFKIEHWHLSQVGGLNCPIGQNRVQVIPTTSRGHYWVTELHFMFSLTLDCVGAIMMPAPLDEEEPERELAKWVDGLESWAPQSVLEGKSAIVISHPHVGYPSVLYHSGNSWLEFVVGGVNVISPVSAARCRCSHRQIPGLVTCPVVNALCAAPLWINCATGISTPDEQDVLLIDAVNSVPLESRFLALSDQLRVATVKWERALSTARCRLDKRVREIKETQVQQKLAGWESIPNDDQSKLPD